MKKLIDKWKLNRNLLASKMKISKGSFNNKLSGTKSYKFSDLEILKLKKIFSELKKDIEKL